MKTKPIARVWAGLSVAVAAGILVLLAVPSSGQVRPQISGASFQPVVQRQFQMRRLGIEVPVLDRASFQALYGANTEIPRNSVALRNLSRRLNTPGGRESINEECGEYEQGLLFAALQNPDITDAERDAVDADADEGIPPLPRTYTNGHFRFLYTDSNPNPDHNSTLADIQATAVVLNAAWSDFAANFTEPKSYSSGGTKLVDVKCYYLGPSLYGQTGSGWNHIDLNSKHVVRNAYKRQTTPPHELFHRVQYQYGYVSGTPGMKWADEGTAAWAQKRRAPAVGDYLARMNEGLGTANRRLMDRSYDAAHFWIYLGERGGGEVPTIRDVWRTYQTNGHNMTNAVRTVIPARIPGQSFDSIANWWMFTNAYKDMRNAAPGFDYAEDETRTAAGYGPLIHLTRSTATLMAGTDHTVTGAVAQYGANYYLYNLPAGAARAQITITAPAGNFGYAYVLHNGDTMVSYARTPAGGLGNWSQAPAFAPGSATQMTIIVMGDPNGGTYTLRVRAER